MSARVVIDSDGRKVTVETSADVPIADVVEQAAILWLKAKSRTRPAPPERPELEAGGFGFQAERAEAPSYGDESWEVQ